MYLRAVISIIVFIAQLKAECIIKINRDISNPQPLIINPNSEGFNKFFMPKENDSIILHSGEILQVHCLGNILQISNDPQGIEHQTARCHPNRLFSIDRKFASFSTFTCNRYPLHTLRLTGNSCLRDDKFVEFEIGFEVNEEFLRLLSGCFDPTVQITAYVEMNMNYLIRGRQWGQPRPSWTEGPYYQLNGNALNTLYTRNVQRRSINRLLGLEENSTKYVHETNNFFLARGHLSAKTDFIFGNHQRATFYFKNAAPQWQMFNGGNWLTLEINLRRFVENNYLNVSVYTGTFGVATLPHEVTGARTELYLYVDGETKAIPVPKFFWKVVYEPVTGNATAFIGVNNIYIDRDDLEEYLICDDVCDKISWANWSNFNLTRGYTYCCEVDDFRRTVTNLPEFHVADLLR